MSGVEAWKQQIYEGFRESRQQWDGYAPLIAQYQKQVGQLKREVDRAKELQLALNDAKVTNTALSAEVNRLKDSTEHHDKGRLEEMEQKLHAQQEELTSAYKTKLDNAEQMLRLNQLVQDQAATVSNAENELKELRGVAEEKNTSISNLEQSIVDKGNALLQLKHEYDAEKSLRLKVEKREGKLKMEHTKLVQRWMEKVKTDADMMNRQLEAEDRRRKEEKSKRLQEDAMKNFGAPLQGDYHVNMNTVPSVKERSIDAHSLEGNDVAFSVSGSTLASASTDKMVKLWNPKGSLTSSLVGNAHAVMCVDFTPNEDMILGASNDKTVKVWRPSSGQVVYNLTGHDNKVYSAKFFSDIKIVSGSCDRSIKCWDLTKGYCTKTICFASTCNSISPGKTYTWCASGHFDKSVRLWDLRNGKSVHQIEGLHEQQICHVDFAADSNRLLSVGRDSVLKMTDVRTFETICTMQHKDMVVPFSWSKATLSPDGAYVACGSHDGTLFIFNTTDGSFHSSLSGEHDCAVSSCAWSALNIASIDKKGKVVVWGEAK